MQDLPGGPKASQTQPHSWTRHEPELSIMLFSQLLNTSSCPCENSEMGEEDCQNSGWLHISILVPLALNTVAHISGSESKPYKITIQTINNAANTTHCQGIAI